MEESPFSEAFSRRLSLDDFEGNRGQGAEGDPAPVRRGIRVTLGRRPFAGNDDDQVPPQICGGFGGVTAQQKLHAVLHLA